MAFLARNPEAYAGQVVDNGHCVRFLQVAANVPLTSQWRRGALVRGADPPVPTGTCIATFDANGRYENNTTGRSHAAILVTAQSDGLLVWDQWVGHPVAQRVIRHHGGPTSNAMNDGDHFHVIEVHRQETA